MIHYYFKYGTANKNFEELIQKKVIQKKIFEKIPLSIYFWQSGVDGKADYLIKKPCLFSWKEITAKDIVRLTHILKSNYDADWVKTAKITKTDSKTIMITAGENFLSLSLNNENTELSLKIDNDQSDTFIVKTENGKLNIYSTKAQKKQVNAFFKVYENPKENYFWIFYRDKIFCYQAEDGNIFNGDEQYPCLINVEENNEKFIPKSMIAVCKQIYNKRDLPEVFANINSSQSYNRVTIKKLDTEAELIANYLINKENNNNNNPRIPMKKCDLNFLSPIEFETLIFLIFNHESSLCSSYRGGTLEGFDLKVSLKEFEGLPDGISCDSIHWIQVKKKTKIIPDEMKKQVEQKDRILIYLGNQIDEHRILGKEWITDIIDKRRDIQRWLKEMTFRHEIFDFSL